MTIETQILELLFKEITKSINSLREENKELKMRVAELEKHKRDIPYIPYPVYPQPFSPEPYNPFSPLMPPYKVTVDCKTGGKQ